MKKSSDPIISIIIPAYNCEKYITKCLSSIKNQICDAYEVLVVNDGSTDGTKEVCEKYINNDERFILYNKVNEGVSKARNYALARVRGKYVTFIDSDDWINQNFLSKMIEKIEEKKADIICCCYNCVTDNEKKAMINVKDKLLTKNEALDGFSDYYFTSVWGKAFKKSIIEELKFEEDILYSEDTLFYTQAVLKSQKIFWISETMYNYRINEDGALKNKNLNKYFTDIVAREKILDLYVKNGIKKESAEYWLLDSLINVKKEFYKNGKFKDEKLIYIDKKINRLKDNVNKKQKIRLLILKMPYLIYIYNNLKNRK